MEKIYNNKIITIFFLIQPIVDILTSLLNITASVGILLRGLFALYALTYCFIKGNKWTYIYLAVSSIYLLTNLIGHAHLNNSFIVGTQMNSLIHLTYFPVVLLFFYKYFTNNKAKLLDNKTFILNSLIIGLSLVLSMATKTNLCSYEKCIMHGTTGWFNSANEYGIILVFLLSISMTYMMKSKSILPVLSYLLINAFMVLIGTKTTYIAMLFINIGYVLFYIVSCFIDKKRIKKYYRYNLLFLVMGISAIIFFPMTPLKYNIDLRAQDGIEKVVDNNVEEKVDIDISKEELHDNYQIVIDDHKNEVEDSQKRTVAFNGRDEFLSANKQLYKEASLFDKLFGITTQAKGYEHLTEMDMFDVLFLYGIFAVILDIVLMAYIIVKILIGLIKHMDLLFDSDVALPGMTLFVFLLVIWFAGHVLLQPAVSIYLAYLLIYLYKKVGVKNE
jgi:hypothetical protein